MTRLTTLLICGVAAIAVPNAALAEDSATDPLSSQTQVGSVDLAPLEALDDLSSADPLALSLTLGRVDLSFGLDDPDFLTGGDLSTQPSEELGFGRDLLLGLGDAREGFEGGAFAGTLIELADQFSIATLFRSSEGPTPYGASEPGFGETDASTGHAWYLGVEARYRPSEQLSIGLSYGALREVDRMLGLPTDTELAEADQALTQSLGLGVSYVFNERLSATVFYDHVRVDTDGSGFGGGDSWSGQKLGASVELSRIFTATDQLSFAALQPFSVFSSEFRANAPFGELDGAGTDNPLSALLDPEAVPMALSFSYMDRGAEIPRGLTFSLEDDDVRDTDGLNVSAVATVKVPF